MTKHQLKEILIKGTLIGLGILLYSTVMVTFFADFAFSIHDMMFDISREQFNFSVYLMMGVFKLMWLVVFVIPYFAIVWSEKK
ncbi:hypothetical protein DID73_01415 [Candidatus Marinamargulisbacteria bacterium SCGC AG-343-K17]|nr:hypothetical protein DID73_01415 [Candidatus Marinamargulisbacteria bacterium SCGC AG-343-K17]